MSLDGKTLCGTLRPLERAVHLLALVDHHTGYVLSPSCLGCRTRNAMTSLSNYVRWPGVKQVCQIVRARTIGEDRCTIKGRHVPQNLAALNWFCHHGPHKITATLRSFTRNSQCLFSRPSHQN